MHGRLTHASKHPKPATQSLQPDCSLWCNPQLPTAWETALLTTHFTSNKAAKMMAKPLALFVFGVMFILVFVRNIRMGSDKPSNSNDGKDDQGKRIFDWHVNDLLFS